MVVAGKTAIAVGIGELHLTDDPSTFLVAHGLGSCVGVTAYDPARRLAALLHVMLPSSAEARNPGPPAKYADTGIPLMLELLRERGADVRRLQIKAAGGSCILVSPAFGDKFRIGERNIAAVQETLERLGLRLAGQELGGQHGRTLELHTDTGLVTVRTIGQAAREI
ncbi:MAG TPA: chemotaxis protein CheD [Dehalococcoidia bacterium]